MKNRLTVLFLFCLAVAAAAFADPVSREQAQKMAEKYLLDKPGSHRLSPVSSSRRQAQGKDSAEVGTKLYYVFDRGENQGYVIVPADDSYGDIIGYTEEGRFSYDSLPPHMQNWLECQAQYIAFLRDNPDKASQQKSSRRRVAVHASIEPMVTTKWGQGWPYNNECPIYFGEGRSITGCVATAMAQLMYYQREKSVREVQKSIPNYTLKNDEKGTMVVEGIPAGSPIDWDNMLDTYSSSSSEKSCLAVAQLMHYCGVSVRMGYSPGGSGASTSYVPVPLKEFFGYGDNPRAVWAHNYSDENSWDEILYRELEQQRPFQLAGHTQDGAGHSFVCDGYKDGLYHINWGWDGGSDGYFALKSMNGWSFSQCAIINFEPNDFSSLELKVANTKAKQLCLDNWDSDGDGKFTYGEAAAVTDLGAVFRGQTFTAFNELYYFTSVTSIPDDAFSGCQRLSSIRLPKKLQAIGARAFSGCSALKTLVLPDGITSIGEEAFSGCTRLEDVKLPVNITRIEARTFAGCQTFAATSIPICVTFIGDGAFSGCTNLASVTVGTERPQNLQLGADVFAEVDKTQATLNFPQGLRDYFANAEQWKDFANLNELRTLSQGQFASLAQGKRYYVYNVGTGRYLTHGEAYGMQGVVADTDAPMRFEFRKRSNMGDDEYYLYSSDSPNKDNRIFFRSSTDSNVGKGIKACFVDGASTRLNENGLPANWTVKPVEGQDKVYTIQCSEGTADFVQGLYLGVQPGHESNASFPTYGTYFDIPYAQFPLNCQWMLVEFTENALLYSKYSSELQNLLSIADTQHFDATTEKAVYADTGSSLSDLQHACSCLRAKLGFVNFEDDAFRDIVLSRFDGDGNKEISQGEMAGVKQLPEKLFANNKDLLSLSDLKHFTGLQSIDMDAFSNCPNVTEIALPENVESIGARAFNRQPKVTKITLPSRISTISSRAFFNCIALQEVYVPVANPADITINSAAFNFGKSDDNPLSDCILYVPFGSKQLYQEAAVWSKFNDIREYRVEEMPEFVAPQTNTDYYIYNKGMKKFITRGESWGTQAVVGTQPLTWQLRRRSGMPTETYYFYSEDLTDRPKKAWGRVFTDRYIGDGKSTFTDTDINAHSYWAVSCVDSLERLYTFQPPVHNADYVEGEYAGVDLQHASNVSPTYGVYWDISYESNPKNCQWGFVEAAKVKANRAKLRLDAKLYSLIEKAQGSTVDATPEQAVYHDPASTGAELREAIVSLRRKLSLVPFIDEQVELFCVNTWDDDEDGELSVDEAAFVSDIGVVFKGNASITSLEDLRFFTGLTEIPSEAFRSNASMISVILPQNVTKVGKNAFASCTELKYVAVLNPTAVVDIQDAGMPSRALSVFVPENMVEAYKADSKWKSYTILPYTGIPVVQIADAAREYGRTSAKASFKVSGAPVNALPVVSVNNVATLPVGTYPIGLSNAENITSLDLQINEGTLTVSPAPVTVTAQSYTRMEGQPNPEFAYTMSSLRNHETAAEVFLQMPVVTCQADESSPAGEYEITVSGAEALNYAFTYVNGILTVEEDPDGIAITPEEKGEGTLYDLLGRRIENRDLKRGVYILNGRKYIRKLLLSGK